MAATRNVEQVTREIEQERDQLAAAVSQLRGELRRATDVRTIARDRLPELGAAVVLGVGLMAAVFTLRRRRRIRERQPEPLWKLRIGRYMITERP